MRLSDFCRADSIVSVIDQWHEFLARRRYLGPQPEVALNEAADGLLAVAACGAENATRIRIELPTILLAAPGLSRRSLMKDPG